MKTLLFFLFTLFISTVSSNAQESIEQTLLKYKTIGSKAGDITEYFTKSEIHFLQSYLADKENKNAPLLKFNDSNRAYGYESFSNNFIEFNIENPAILTPINESIVKWEVAGAINYKNPEVGYAYSGWDGEFYKIDVPTGKYTSLGITIPYMANGMAFNPVNDRLYAVGNSMLFEIDLKNNKSYAIGVVDLNQDVQLLIALAIDGNGNAYSYDIISDKLYAIDLTTAKATEIGPIGFDANFAQGMDWDPVTNTVYMAAFNNSNFKGEWRSVDTNTGMTTLIGEIGATDSNMTWVSMIDKDLNTTDYTTTNLSYYPNPVKDFIYFTGSKPIEKIQIYNSIGQIIRQYDSIEQAKLNLVGLKKGSYILVLDYKDKTRQTIKILKD